MGILNNYRRASLRFCRALLDFTSEFDWTFAPLLDFYPPRGLTVRRAAQFVTPYPKLESGCVFLSGNADQHLSRRRPLEFKKLEPAGNWTNINTIELARCCCTGSTCPCINSIFHTQLLGSQYIYIYNVDSLIDNGSRNRRFWLYRLPRHPRLIICRLHGANDDTKPFTRN
jgi:hypothetical protein